MNKSACSAVVICQPGGREQNHDNNNRKMFFLPFHHSMCCLAFCHKYSEAFIGGYLSDPSRHLTVISSSGLMKYPIDLRVL